MVGVPPEELALLEVQIDLDRNLEPVFLVDSIVTLLCADATSGQLSDGTRADNLRTLRQQ